MAASPWQARRYWLDIRPAGIQALGTSNVLPQAYLLPFSTPSAAHRRLFNFSICMLCGSVFNFAATSLTSTRAVYQHHIPTLLIEPRSNPPPTQTTYLSMSLLVGG